MTDNLLVREVFSAASRARLEHDEPITAIDASTGIGLSYRFEQHAGGTLRLSGGLLGMSALVVACDEDALNLVATLLLDGIAVQFPESDTGDEFLVNGLTSDSPRGCAVTPLRRRARQPG